ncbi:MAG: hypothetical protein IAG10_11055 [Planctomycetaceae bacterium]|nr:hypothetical protein [Planctomycetaceae bacterium]
MNCLAAEIFSQTEKIEAVLIESSLLLDHRNRKAIVRRHNSRKHAIDDAFAKSDFSKAKDIVCQCDWTPNTFWWCNTKEEAVAVLSGIYQRLKAQSKSDAYNIGVFGGSVVRLLIWED